MNILLTQISEKTVGDYTLNFFTNFFGTPALLVGLTALIGSLIQRKKFSETIISVFKTIIGFLIIGGGAAIISGSIQKFGAAFQLLFNRNGFIPNNDSLPGQFLEIPELTWIVSMGSLILIFAMLLNIVLAKISKLKYIYLSGHVGWYFSVMIAGVLAIVGLKNVAKDMVLIVVIGSLLVSMWMVISPAILNRHMQLITKTDQLALAHTGSLTYMVSGYAGELVNKIFKGKTRSTESFNFPKGLSFLRNTNVSIALTMFIIYTIVYMTTWGVRGEQAMISAEILAKSGSQSIFVQGLIQAFTFAAGVEVLLIGVRMFIAEIVPAFKGIGDKLVRNAKPGIDCPVVFPFAPNAVIIGFLASTIGGFLVFGINIGVSSTLNETSKWAVIIIPSIVPHFFTGATSGVFGNAKGGVIGAIVGGFINGVLISFVPWIFLGLDLLQQEVINSANNIWGDADFILGLIPALIVRWTNKWVLLGITIISWLMVPTLSLVIHYYKMKNNPDYKILFLSEKKILKELIWEKETLKENYKTSLFELSLSKKEKDKKLYHHEKVKQKKEYLKAINQLQKNYDQKIIANKQNLSKGEK